MPCLYGHRTLGRPSRPPPVSFRSWTDIPAVFINKHCTDDFLRGFCFGAVYQDLLSLVAGEELELVVKPTWGPGVMDLADFAAVHVRTVEESDDGLRLSFRRGGLPPLADSA